MRRRMEAGDVRRLLGSKHDLGDWETLATTCRETQLYLIGSQTESLRRVDSASTTVTVYHDHVAPDGRPARGWASFDVAPADTADAVERRLEEAVRAASLASSPPWPVAGPAAYPTPEAYDPALAPERAPAELEALKERLLRAVAACPGVRLSAAEFFATETAGEYRSSRGAEAYWRSTRFYTEFVLLAGSGDEAGQGESYCSVARRRLADFSVEETVAERARRALDSIGAPPPPTGRMPVVVTGEDVSRLFEPFVFAASGEAVYRGLSGLEAGRPLLGERPVRGDRLTLVSDGLLPFGLETAAVAPDGLPMTRLTLVEDGVVRAIRCSLRYGAYLGLPSAGGPGNLVVGAGSVPEERLLQRGWGPSGEAGDGRFLHVVAFTDPRPDPVRGDFVGEVRLGYYHGPDGRIQPVHGGSVAGNLYDAFAEALLSRETHFLGDYLGPRAVRFASLTVAGE